MSIASTLAAQVSNLVVPAKAGIQCPLPSVAVANPWPG